MNDSIAPKPLPRVSDIRKVMPADRHRRSLWKALLITFLDAAAYLSAFFGVVFIPTWPGKIIWGLGTGLLGGMCYALAHDGAHLDLTDTPWLDRLIANLAFLPSLHSVPAWELAHNRLHHGWTNLRGKDHVHAPYTKQEFDSWSWRRQTMERIYRSVPGIGLLYVFHFWVRHMIWLQREDIELMTSKHVAAHRVGVGTVCAFLVGQALSLILFSQYVAHRLLFPELAVWPLLLVGVVWPFFVCHWLLAFVTLLHHTHPKTKWFNKEDEWSFYAGQVQGTVHVKFSRVIELLFHESLEHTAHHVDPKIPLYNLRASQKCVEEAFDPDVIIEQGSFKHLRTVLSKCKLYDYDNHRWLDFDGNPTT